MRLAKFVPLFYISCLLLFPAITFAWCNNCGAGGCCPCPGQAQCLGSYSSCEEACGLAAPGGRRPGYDYEAERRAQEAAEAERRHSEAEREQQHRAEESRRQLEEIERQNKFFEERDAAARTLRGSTGVGSDLKGTDAPLLKGSGGTSGTSELRGSTPGRAPGTGPTSIPSSDPMVVDARNVPSGLPKSAEDAIPHTPAGDRVRKGFQAILAHDWPMALAWFRDALKYEPDSPGIRRLIDLGEFTLQRQAGNKYGAEEKTDGAMHSSGIAQELFTAMSDYYKARPPVFDNVKQTYVTDEEFLKEKEPAWKNFFRMLTPRLKADKVNSVIVTGIRG